MAIVRNSSMTIVDDQENYKLNEAQLSELIGELVNILPIQNVRKSFSDEESIIIDLFEIIDQSEKRQIKTRDKITDLYDIIQNKKL